VTRGGDSPASPLSMHALHLLNVLAEIEKAKDEPAPAPKKRGRPKGSKNRPKVSHGDIR